MEEERKTTVYIESSIISYLAARPSRDLIVAAHQQVTFDWWQNVRGRVECFISPFVLDEIKQGDPEAAQKRMALAEMLSVLKVDEGAKELASLYFQALDIPKKAEIDCFHLAMAVWNRLDCLLSWNCKHIANIRIIQALKKINREYRLPTPVIGTPENYMEI